MTAENRKAAKEAIRQKYAERAAKAATRNRKRMSMRKKRTARALESLPSLRRVKPNPQKCRGRGKRVFDCPNYPLCLHAAGMGMWPSFTCEQCGISEYEKEWTEKSHGQNTREICGTNKDGD